jgi:pyridoxine 5-phosphate synthase
MATLSVNINKIATIRNARGGNTPNVCKVAIDCEKFGADGITVHPRPDERHIKYADVYQLKERISTEFNIEGYPSTDFIKLINEVRPHQVTLVPDPPEAITSNAGWDTVTHLNFLKEVVARFKDMDVRVSIFVGTDLKMIEYASKTGTDRVELYTEPYASAFPKNREDAIAPFVAAAIKARDWGLGLNAGHDLSLENLNFLYKSIPWIDEVSIGHALISDALYLGLETTIKKYKDQLR